MLAAIYAAGIAAEFGATIYVLHAMDAATDPILEPVALDTKKFEEGKGPLSGLIELAEIFMAPVHVVSFIDEGEGQAGQYLDVTWHLNHYLEFLQRSFPNVTFLIHLLEGNDLQESIDEYCRQQNVDLVAVLSHPRSLIDKLCRRNNSRRTVFHSHVPVLVLPGQ